MINRLMAVSYQFLVEMILGLLFIFFYFITINKLPPLLILLIICLSGMILFFFQLDRWKNKGKWLYFFTVFPLLLLIGSQVGLSLLVCAILGLLIFWRGIFLYEDTSEHSVTSLLLLSFLVGMIIIVYSSMSQYRYQDQIIFLLIFQLFIVFVGSFIRKWSTIKEDRLRFALFFLKVLAVISFIGLTIAFLIKYIRFFFISVAQFISALFVFMLNPLFSKLGILVNNSKPAHYKIGKVSDMDEASDLPWQLPFPKILFFLLLLAGVCYVVYLISKRRLKAKEIEDNRSPFFSISELSFKEGSGFDFGRKIKPPEDSIRREIFNFEKYASKLRFGRYSFETLEEWWQRIGLYDTEQIIEIYEKNRYGCILSSHDDLVNIKSKIPILKQQLKAMAKYKKS